MEPTSVIGTKNKKGQVFTDPRIMMREAPRTPSFYTGSEVIKEAIRRASIDVMIAYPITPQSEAAALIGALFAEGYIGDYFRGESEFAVMSQCAGDSCLHDDGRSRNHAGDGKLPHVGGCPLADPMHRNLSRDQFPAVDSTGHHRDLLSDADRHARLACGDGTGLL